MTKIKALLASCAAVESDAQPHEPLHLVLENIRLEAERAAGMSLVPLATLYTSSNVLVHNWESPHHIVGTADLTVIFRAQSQGDLTSQLMVRMAALEQRSEEQEQREAEMFAFLAAPRISNVAGQILDQAAGNEIYDWLGDNKFSSLEASDPAVQEVSELTHTAAETIVDEANKVIAQRHSHAHVIPLDALQPEVDACKRAVTLYPTLRQQLRFDCWVLDNFAHFEAAFYPNLG